MNDLSAKLGALFDSYGYRRYKMNKFEQYDLYARNKDFLLSEQVITFTDTNGALMALKPDVTLSIIKNGRDADGQMQKVYYNEKVYRPASGGVFREIDQMGLECIGRMDDYTLSEVLSLAAGSLQAIGRSGVLVISHLGVVKSVLAQCTADETTRAALRRALGEKNRKELASLCPEQAELLEALASLYGRPCEVLNALCPLLSGEALSAARQLRSVLSAFEGSAVENLLRLDFSVAVDAKYYDGIAFEGFIEGIPERVLSGGCYDPLMRKMGRRASAIGFAVYPDLLSRLAEREKEEITLLVYPEGTSPAVIHEAADKERAAGRRVRVQPQGLQTDGFDRIIRLGE